jgi:hypothetical protein
MSPPDLLNEDGSASMATMIMMSHHGFRRDLALFARALKQPVNVPALQAEWKGFHEHLHGHHQAEDQGIFPDLRSKQPELVAVIEGLTADHRRIDPLLEEGDGTFAQLPGSAAAAAVVARLSALLDPHLATEEARVLPFLRGAKEFPTPATEAELDLYAEGFGWALLGIAPDIVERIQQLLPPALTARLPAACVAFEARCRRAWGSVPTGASRTPIPDWLPGG